MRVPQCPIADFHNSLLETDLRLPDGILKVYSNNMPVVVSKTHFWGGLGVRSE